MLEACFRASMSLFLSKHLFIWKDCTFTAWMASSRSFSCSSWGDCCVIGWKEKKNNNRTNKQNQTELSNFYEAVYDLIQIRFPQFRIQCKWHCSVTTQELSNSCVICKGESSQDSTKTSGQGWDWLWVACECHCFLECKAKGTEQGQILPSDI